MRAAKPKIARPGGPGRLSAEDAAQLEDRLLDAALHLFTRNGFAGTTMEAIARQAGASTKTIYARYANKADILGAVNHRVTDRIAASRQGAAPDPLMQEPRDVLLALGRTLAHVYDVDETVGLTRIAISEAHRLPALGDFFVAGFTKSVKAVGQLLAAWEQTGKLTLPGKPETSARIFIEMAAGIPRIRALIGKPLPAAELEEHVTTAVEIFLKGCGVGDGKSVTSLRGRKASARLRGLP